MIDQLKTDFDKTITNLKLSNKNLEIRKKNLNQFSENGFPNKRIEDWKFSDLNQIITSNIKDLNFYNNLPSEKVDKAIFVNKFEHNKIIFVNGVISNIDLSYEDETKVSLSRNLDFNEDHNETNPLISLNNAFTSSYIGITVKESYSFKCPLIIYNITNNALKSTALNIRTDIFLEKNSNLKLITLFDDSSENNFINIVQNFDIAQDAILKSYKIDHKKNSNIKYFYNNINLEKNSISENFIFSTGSKFIKNEVNCNLNDQYSSAFINGVINLTRSCNTMKLKLILII